MNERDLQTLIAVRAFEEADPGATLLTRGDRATAAQAASRPDGSEQAASGHERFVVARAHALRQPLEDRLPALGGVLRFSRLGFAITPIVLLASFVGGLLTNVLGPDRHINLLSFPLFLLLAWNIAIYLAGGVVELVALVRRRGTKRPAGTSRMTHVLYRLALWRGWHLWRRLPGASEEGQRITEGLGRYAALWWQHAGTLLTTRVRAALHLGAIAMILAAIGGMYLRGFALRYSATWESTLLSAAHVQAFLDVVLTPAAAILGRRVPDVAGLEAPGAEHAAVWLHLYGITALLVVVVPRLLLWLVTTVRVRRLARNLSVDLDAPYFRKLLGSRRGDNRRIEIVPYSFTPKATSLDALKALMYDYFGARADVQVRVAVDYGDEALELFALNGNSPASSNAGPTCHVVVFNLAQSPEIEVHGEYLDTLKHELETRQGQIIVLIDVTTYKQRIEVPERLKERLRAWERILKDTGLRAVDVDTNGPIDDSLLDAMRDAIWPPAD